MSRKHAQNSSIKPKGNHHQSYRLTNRLNLIRNMHQNPLVISLLSRELPILLNNMFHTLRNDYCLVSALSRVKKLVKKYMQKTTQQAARVMVTKLRDEGNNVTFTDVPPACFGNKAVFSLPTLNRPHTSVHHFRYWIEPLLRYSTSNSVYCTDRTCKCLSGPVRAFE
ncbi:hypothetical protein BT96DRAFT_299432 [Gymnopus androsaceus JB14]|uniref:Uncharacterized protein n=1 Tax=Gymnopus androsaceus JB14 TaxID=1447944 RepID=A0A6A4H230_9AGAR|nr:hypothetical protein BT96DRAFT_299432 [Gymnopus androsaceus JB14]